MLPLQWVGGLSALRLIMLPLQWVGWLFALHLVTQPAYTFTMGGGVGARVEIGSVLDQCGPHWSDKVEMSKGPGWEWIWVVGRDEYGVGMGMGGKNILAYYKYVLCSTVLCLSLWLPRLSHTHFHFSVLIIVQYILAYLPLLFASKYDFDLHDPGPPNKLRPLITFSAQNRTDGN